MPLTYGKVAGNTILAADHNEVGLLLKGQSGSGEGITLIYNAAGAIILQPSSDPAAGTQLFQIKNNAGTVQLALTSDGVVVVGTTPATTGAIRIPNNQYVYARNAANSADRIVAGIDTTDTITIWDGFGAVNRNIRAKATDATGHLTALSFVWVAY